MRVTNSIMGMTMLVVVACSLFSSPASASTIPVPILTGGAGVEIFGNGMFGIVSNTFTLGSRFGFATVPGIQSTPDSAPCTAGTALVICGWSWSGSLKGESISFLVLPSNSAPYDNGFSFSGVITDGTYSGSGTAACLAVCETNLHETAQFTFTGKWAEGYVFPQPPPSDLFSAKGSFAGTSWYQSGGLPGVPGDAQFGSSFGGPIETFTSGLAAPEPSTLLMLGSGGFGLAGVLRRKLTR